MTPGEALKQIIEAALDVAREEAARQEQELGRKLTDTEAMRLAEMVERQLKTVLVLSQF